MIAAGATLVAGSAVLCALLALARARDLPLAVGVLLDMLLAAGLLRLAGSPGWPQLATAASLVVLRKLLTAALHAAAARASQR